MRLVRKHLELQTSVVGYCLIWRRRWRDHLIFIIKSRVSMNTTKKNFWCQLMKTSLRAQSNLLKILQKHVNQLLQWKICIQSKRNLIKLVHLSMMMMLQHHVDFWQKIFPLILSTFNTKRIMCYWTSKHQTLQKDSHKKPLHSTLTSKTLLQTTNNGMISPNVSICIIDEYYCLIIYRSFHWMDGDLRSLIPEKTLGNSQRRPQTRQV